MVGLVRSQAVPIAYRWRAATGAIKDRCAFSKHYPPENYVVGHYRIA
jgi:hypothetical protein